ncbi:hypothetical protein CFHF_19915 [Caulobacter flavus]|uniref:DUF4267 domain-containing protein n=1 Tax=Caulobacter flavus TaxID=1679497 RepID=A0A2N5CP35_9CAUL|nr:hypothetical protein [Caulobacter flavus]AYV48564.1 hypothetical protein C1707_21150 [Caulobacter flavus]PLR08719.1 hypothetical protein CFHF_19915 [Caulobacter flavus]
MALLTKVKQGVGAASVILGLAALIAPRRFAGLIGASPDTSAEAIAAFGSRELAAGAALLAPVKFGPFLWLRVAGDAMDLGGLALAGRKPAADKKLLAIASVAVVAITLFDLALALDGDGN